MRKNQPHHRMARLELLESRQMLAAGDVLVQLTRADSDFGADVQIAGDLLIVGAPSDDSEATDAGRVYVYQLNGTPNPDLVRTITNPLPAGQNFGRALDTDGERLIVGAKGNAFIFDLDDPAFSKTIVDPTVNDHDDFGADVAISGNHYVVIDNSGSAALEDEVHAYNLQTDARTLIIDTDISQGLCSVAINGNFIAVGYARGVSLWLYDGEIKDLADYYTVNQSSAGFTAVAMQETSVENVFRTLVGGTHVDVPDEGGSFDGSAAIYTRGLNGPRHTWFNPNPVSAGEGTENSERFGAAVDYDGLIAAVGEPQGESAANGHYDSPGVGIYNTKTGEELAYVTAPEAPLASSSPYYHFGRSIAVAGQYVAVGADSAVVVLDSGRDDLNEPPVLSGVSGSIVYEENGAAIAIAPEHSLSL